MVPKDGVFLNSDYMHHHGYHHVLITRKLARRAMMALMMSGTTFNGGGRGAPVSIELALPLWLGVIGNLCNDEHRDPCFAYEDAKVSPPDGIAMTSVLFSP
jgi:hypothetical protein